MLKPSRLLVYFIYPLSFFFVASSCNTFDPPLTVPVYGHIDSMHLIVPSDSLSELGSAASFIPYVWVYLDDNPVGAFQVPCTFPMVASNGVHTVEVYPGITPVGTNSPAGMYPFYQFYSVSINMQQGKTYNIKPVIRYFSWVNFPYLMNFDNFTLGQQPKGNGKYSIINYYGDGNRSGATTTNMFVVGGKLAFQHQSGMVVVTTTHNYYAGMTWPWDSLSFNNSNIPVFVEFNYRATTLFAIGMFDADTTSQSGPIALIYPTTGWKKMYVSLNNTIYPTFSTHYQNIYFTMKLDSIDGHTTDTLLLDNIKILD
jgi:hypothetical protein